MSRFDRRLKGAELDGDGARPGTAVCSLPSSTQNVSMLGGNFLNRQSIPLPPIPPIPQNTVIRKKINGLAVLQTHDQKITTLEKRLMDIESAYTKNISLQEAKTDKIGHQFNLLNNSYRAEMKVLKDYIKDLRTKNKRFNKSR